MKKQLLKGTIILAGAGIVTRMIGFAYRVFLAGAIGETKLGVYQLVFPVYSLCFTLYAAGIQTAVSQIISHEKKEDHPGIIKSALALSLGTAITLSVLLYAGADYVAVAFLGSKEAAELLRILSVLFPFCGVTSIINGYFYGISDAKKPAVSQIAEQLCRVGFVFLISFAVLDGGTSPACAVWGLVAGELAANFYNLRQLWRLVPPGKIRRGKIRLKRLLTLSLPLTGNRLVLSLLSSVESVLIPAMLMRYGHAPADALAIFGVLTGVVMPFVMFPGTLTNSLSVLLLPAISQAAGAGQSGQVRRAAEQTLRYSLLLGVLTGALFLNYGLDIGTLLFQSENAGKLLTALAFLCPFLYASTTLNSIINGLGKTAVTFLNSVLGLSLRIGFLVVVTPRHGIYGYLGGMIASQILICLLDGSYLIRHYEIDLGLMNHLVWPCIFSNSVFFLARFFGSRLDRAVSIPFTGYLTLVPAAILLLWYMMRFNLIRPNPQSRPRA